MDPLHILVLAAIQGLTEFFPVSSSAHLILVPYWLHWPAQGIDFDVALHIGTLLAVLCYFRQRLYFLIKNPFSPLAQYLVIATLPALLVGALCHNWIDMLRTPASIAANTLLFGLLLGLADWFGSKKRNIGALQWPHVLCIGFAQTLALFPGVSRSGVTMSMALALGYSRKAAAEFSFLLSIPVIGAAGAYTSLHLYQAPVSPDWPALGLGVLASFISAYMCIRTFFFLLDRISLQWFVAYRVLLAAILWIQLV